MEGNSWLKTALRSEAIKLVPIMALAFYLAFIPHSADPYPVHVDEWMQISFSQEVIDEGAAPAARDPLGGGSPMPNESLEAGFQTFLASFKMITGISWLAIVKYLPGIIFMATVLAVYIMARRHGFGWEAALFAALIPTTVGILGPGFLVPVALGLLFIALSLFAAIEMEGWRSYVLLGVFVLFLLTMHAATAVGLAIVLFPYVLISLKRDFRRSMGLAAAIVLPFLGALIAIPDIWKRLVVPSAQSLLVPQAIPGTVQVPPIINAYGYIPSLLFVAGTVVLVKRRGLGNLALVLGSLLMLLTLVLFYSFGYGSAMLYFRGLQYLMLLMSIAAGAALMAVRNTRLPVGLAARLGQTGIVRNAGSVSCVVLIVAALSVAIPAHLNTPYYHLIDSEDYEAFSWIRDNLGPEYGKAVLDPWQGTAFVGITGKSVRVWLGEVTDASHQRAYEFLANGCTDTSYLAKNAITIVYTKGSVDNADLIEVRKDVYLLGAVAAAK